ncbi:MAG: hypothetical protein methR_P3306 [Methyloprofundus sp.]|nr:MAG: hypothetical protein methR_P3306 [Methyloprofundus sp.]
MNFLSKSIKCYLICSVFFIPPITSYAARTTQNNSEWRTANEQDLLFTQDQTAATNFTAEAQNEKKATVQTTPIAQQNVSDLPYEIVIWDTDSETKDVIWQDKDTSDAQSLLESFQGLSVQRLSNSANNNAIQQLNKYTEPWNPNVSTHDIPLALQIEDTDEYLSFMRLWHQYGKTIITTLLILTLLRLLIWPIYEEFKDKRRQKIRRSMNKLSHSTQLKNNLPKESKVQTSPQSLSKHGQLIKEKNDMDMPSTTTQSKNNAKHSRRKKNKRPANAQLLSTHGRVLGLKPNKTQSKHRSSRHHYGRRHKPKPPFLKQIMDIFFYKPDA